MLKKQTKKTSRLRKTSLNAKNMLRILKKNKKNKNTFSLRKMGKVKNNLFFSSLFGENECTRNNSANLSTYPKHHCK